MELTKKLPNNTAGFQPGYFTPSEALNVFSARFLDSDACRQWILEQMHKSKPVCPGCHKFIDDTGRLRRFWNNQRLKCRFCDKFFTATSDTFLSGKHIGFRQLFLLSILLAVGIDNCQIAEVVEVDPETVRLWRHRFKALEE